MTNHPNRDYNNKRYVRFMRFWAIVNRMETENDRPEIGFGEAKARFEEMLEIHIPV